MFKSVSKATHSQKGIPGALGPQAPGTVLTQQETTRDFPACLAATPTSPYRCPGGHTGWAAGLGSVREGGGRALGFLLEEVGQNPSSVFKTEAGSPKEGSRSQSPT